MTAQMLLSLEHPAVVASCVGEDLRMEGAGDVKNVSLGAQILPYYMKNHHIRSSTFAPLFSAAGLNNKMMVEAKLSVDL